MDSQTPPSPDQAKLSPPRAEGVSDELLNELHDANEHFSHARHHREEAIDDPSPETTERGKAEQEMRDAEQKVEVVTEEIDRDLQLPR